MKKNILLLLVLPAMLLLGACRANDPNPDPAEDPKAQAQNALNGRVYQLDLSSESEKAQEMVTFVLSFMGNGLGVMEYRLTADNGVISYQYPFSFVLDENGTDLTFTQLRKDTFVGNRLIKAVRKNNDRELDITFFVADGGVEKAYPANLITPNSWSGTKWKSRSDGLSSDLWLLFPTELSAVVITNSPTADALYSHNVCGYISNSSELVLTSFNTILGKAKVTDSPVKLSLLVGDGLKGDYEFDRLEPNGLVNTFWLDPALLSNGSFGLTGFYFVDEQTVLQFGTPQDDKDEPLLVAPKYPYTRNGNKVTIARPDGEIVMELSKDEQTATYNGNKLVRR